MTSEASLLARLDLLNYDKINHYSHKLLSFKTVYYISKEEHMSHLGTIYFSIEMMARMIFP